LKWDSFFPKKTDEIEEIKIVSQGKFSIHVSKEGGDMIYTTVHAPLAPVLFPEIQPEITAAPLEALKPPPVEDRWDLEAKKWQIFRSM
jgi:hypothetical protein